MDDTFDLDDHLLRTKRLARRRRRRAAGLGVGAAALAVGVVALVQRSGDDSVRVVGAATDQAEASDEQTAEPSAGTVPVDTTTAAAPPTTSAVVNAAPTSFFGVDPLGSGVGTEYDLDGTPIRTFAITPSGTAGAIERLTTPGGDEIVLGGKPGGHAVDDDRPCQNRAVTIAGQPWLGDPRQARVADVAGGVLYAARAVCPPGTEWADPGTGWELVRLDLRDWASGAAEVLHFFPAEVDDGGSEWINPLRFAPHEFHVTPDGRTAVVGARLDNGQADDGWAIVPIDDPTVADRLQGCGSARPAYVGDGRFVTACSDAIDVPWTIGSGDSSITTSIRSPRVRLFSTVDPTNSLDPYVLVTGLDGVQTVGIELVHGGTSTPLPAAKGLVAWSLADLGYVDSGAVVPTTLPPPPPPPAPATLTVRYDSELRGASLTPILDVGLAIPAENDPNPQYARFRFSDFGTGTAVAVDPVTGVVVRANVDGRSRRNVIPVDDPDGAIVDIALGPEDVVNNPGQLDPMIYVSRSRTAGDGTERFTLVAYGVSNDSELVNEFGRWETTWGCDETGCGNIVFTGQGIDIGGQVVTAGAPAFAPLGDVSRSPEMPATSDPDACVDDGGGGFFGPFRDALTLNGVTWTLEAVCTYVGEGLFASYAPQADGSLIASFAVHRHSSDTARNVIARFAPDGTVTAYEVPTHIYAPAWHAGRLYALRMPPGGTIELVELTTG